MKIRTGSFNIVFPNVLDMRENLFNLEKVFSNFMSPFNLMPIPNEAPPEFPRITATSKNGHSQLMVSGNNVQVTTMFDSHFWKDLTSCFSYMEDMRDKILASLSLFGLEHEKELTFYYSGLNMQIEFSGDDGIDDPVSFIAGRFFKGSISQSIKDIAFRTTLTVDDTYFINVEISNHRFLEGAQIVPGSLYGMKETSHTLTVNIDINDRLAFNTKNAYLSTKDTPKKIFELSKKFITESLPVLIERGDIVYV